MVSVHLPYVNEIKDRYGRYRYYFRRYGKSHRLPDDPTSALFVAEHTRLLNGEPPTLPGGVTHIAAPAPGTFNALVPLYYASGGFKDLEPRTQRNYRGIIERFLVEHGHRRVDLLRRSHVIKILGEKADTPGAANSFLKRLNTLLEFAVALEWIEVNPARKVRGYKSGEFHTWTEEQIAQFEAAHPLGTMRRLAFDAFLYTGQRVSDVAPMPVPDTRGKIRLVQEKTREPLILSVHPGLKASILACPPKHLTLLATSFGKPFTVKGLGNYMADSIAMAGLPEECVTHGLRKAAARRLAEAGASEHEIMSVTGHRSISELQRYTRAARQELMNESAMSKLS